MLDLTHAKPGIPERLIASSGTVTDDSDEYQPNARVPRMPWTEIDPSTLPEDFSSGMVRKVAIFTVPHGVVSRLRVVGRSAAELGTDEKAEALTQLLDYVDQTFYLDEDVHVIGYRSQTASGLTSTKDYSRALKKPGLHFDNWDMKGLSDVDGRTGRICINLGEYARYFLFMQADLITLRSTHDQPNPHELVTHHLSAFPEIPVFGVRIDPGEAYYATTELIIHDAWSPASGLRDETFTVRGQLQRRQ